MQHIEWEKLQYELCASRSRMETSEIGGRTYHLLDSGAGDAVIALHGLGSMAQELAAPLLPLSARYRLIVPDRPGYGRSDGLSADPLWPEMQACWLHDLLQRRDVRRPIIVAHSISSVVALVYAIQYPSQVAGLVLVTPFCRPTRPAMMPMLRLGTLPVVGELMSRWVYPLLADGVGLSWWTKAMAPHPVPHYLEAMLFRNFVSPLALKTMAAELHGFNAGIVANRTKLRHLAVPTIVLAGGADRTADAERHAKWIVHRLPYCELREIPSAGHLLVHSFPHAAEAAVDDLVRSNRLAHPAGQPKYPIENC